MPERCIALLQVDGVHVYAATRADSVASLRGAAALCERVRDAVDD